jgi:outer membrane protein TolC
LSRLLSALGLLLSGALWAAGPAPLPDPLSLEQALGLARDLNPALARARAARTRARAGSLSAQAVDGARIDLEGRLWAIQPAYRSSDRDRNDSRARLSLHKRLYDFGYSQALREAARQGQVASDLGLVEARQQQRLDIMRAFFDVILADMRQARDNEAMSVAYVSFDKARDRNRLGQLSDVDLLKKQDAYERVRRQQVASVQQQRLARARLAIAMGRPGELASELERPAIPEPGDGPDGDFEVFWSRVQRHNPRLRRLAARVAAAQTALKAARNSESAVLSAEVDASAYHRNTGSTHPLGGGLVLRMPLYSGGRKAAAVAGAQADLESARAALLDARLQLRQQALALWLKRARLRTDLKAVRVAGDYRELYLDRSRALYEQEVKTDLGDAMVRVSEVRLERTRLLFDWAMNEARIKAMSGSLLEEK